ncbi:hypothetical protein ACQP1P_06105 [Dactylosporangium sp. CA-052675]|uniref:hypothetical protein n=1 Tax=Dactylosporangium sp. CA-052675 TaxID=3239927 RepID=UPI003D90C3FC
MPERKKLLLRLDPQVYDAIARWAGDDLRSVNAQIEFALRMALRQAGRDPKRGQPSSGSDPDSAAEGEAGDSDDSGDSGDGGETGG